MKFSRIISIVVLVGAVCTGTYVLTQSSKPPISTPKSTSSVVQHPASSATPSFNKTSYSTTDPASPWVVVNKQHPLQPKTYVPDDLVTPTVPLRVPGNESMQLRSTTAKALESMFTAAKTDNINLMISSGYRSYTYQVSLYGSYVSSMGQATADTQSARPGFSEHQTGQALDIEPTSRKCEVAQCFADTPEGKWLVTNAYRYGFILRYTPADIAVTGYESEPWHYRYVGIPLATEMHKTGVATLEQFFGVSGGQNY